ncbi:iron dicitrate transport regulator FecR [uncultured Hydrogenophaga sp.]|uniref:iron dicitrate transport regulator FecR n=1 Tax=uncultured Hydrogenophaga sp. TaxID=199683 RepID=UPI00265E920B|nr:iron dicitrate transport regulator FecR [uncultured Hydrogenophaga sp.]
MTQHALQGRVEAEITWFQRRQTLQAAAAWVALGGFGTAVAQQRSNVIELVGDILLNGARLVMGQSVQTGDEIVSGPASRLTFVLGNAAFHVRQNSRLRVERGSSLNNVSGVRLLAGALGSAFGSGSARQIVTPTLTVGIRGTGVYTEVMANEANRTYFCNCYGTVDLATRGDQVVSTSSYHQSFWGEVQPRDGRFITPAPALNHTDEELEFLARLIGQRTAWQVAGRTGVKDGRGYMEQRGPEAHPAAMPR